MNNTQRRLPLIPLSPLINTSGEYAKLLAEITQSLTDDNKPSTKSTLEKNMIKESEKLDRLMKNMQVIQNSTISNFSINDIAKEIAYINCSLFRMVSLNEQWLCTFDKQSNIVPLVDFHRYMSHSFAHQVIMNHEAIKNIKRPSSIIGVLIQVAYTLLNIYRDFSGCTAILTSLQMPEVQRLESVWSICPPKILNMYEDLVLMISPHNGYKAYYQQLSAHMSPLLNTTTDKSKLIAVPFMQAHLSTLHTLVNTHSSSSTDVVLSSTGQQQLASFVHVLEFLQQHSQIDPSEFFEYRVSSKRKSKRVSTIKLSIPPCMDLDQIRSNPNIYHWLVSRVYLDRHQLHTESLNVEPLAVGEIELEPEEEHDFFWDFYSVPPTKPKRTSVVDETRDDTNTNKQPSIVDMEVNEPIPQKRHSATQTMPILSPVAPEFIPVDSDLVIFDDDEEEEEWTGYPLGSQVSDDESEEEWTGYPIQEDEEEEDEEEIWKGYPIPQEETSPVEPSTPPQEEQIQETDEFPYNVIGKAAARRMQYSVSNTDTARKRLPSPFAPSTST